METRPPTPTYGFTTMGCPEASLAEVIGLAREFHMDFVELRALGGTVQLPDYFAKTPLHEDLLSGQPAVRLVATNLSLVKATDEDIADFLRFVDVAVALRAPYVRVFGGGEWGRPLSPDQWECAVRTMKVCREAIKTKAAACEILLETHLAFSSSSICLEFNERFGTTISILWDTHHTWRNADEMPIETWQKLGPLIRHIHTSDSRIRTAPGMGYDCVLPGTGQYPFHALRLLLEKVGYAYGVSLEWEKIWNPELPDIRFALKEYLRLLVERPVEAIL
jgi:sugar phosphate isomerase/epimerase